MSDTPILWSRGLKANLPSVGVDGTWYYTTDTNELFYGVSLTKVNSGSVSSVAGRVGAIILAESDIANLASDLAALTGSITAEATTRATADATLQANITSEASSRVAGDAASVTAAEGYTDSSIATEVTNRNAAIATEAARAEAAEALLAPKNNAVLTGTTSAAVLTAAAYKALPEMINAVTDFGADNTGVADATAAIQSALNAAGTTKATVFFPAGIYKVSQLVLTTAHSGVKMLGPAKPVGGNANAAVLKASGVGPMITNYGSVGFECFIIENICFNGNNVATVGVFLDTTFYSTIRNCWFISFAGGQACVQGGGCLYTTVEHCIFDASSGSRSLDFQNGYASTPANSYYGCNDGWFQFNSDYTGVMMRIGGDNYILYNDLEGALNTPALAAIDCTDTSTDAATSKTTVSGNYIELTSGTATKVRSVYVGGTCAVVTNNTMFGPGFGGGSPVGTAIEFAVEVLSGDISGNSVRRWNIGLQMNNVGTGNGSLSVIGNYWESGTVSNMIEGYTTHSSSADADVLSGNLLCADRLYMLFRSLSLFVSDVQSADTTIDLSYANHFSYNNSASTTILASAINAKPGSFFWITCVAGSLTLTNGSSAFNLAAGANYTIPVGTTLMFVVMTNGKVYEVGTTSVNETARAEAAEALLAPKNNAALTGAPTAPTPVTSDSSTAIATTAMVHAAVSAATAGVATFNGRSGTVLPASGDYTAAEVTGAVGVVASGSLTGIVASTGNTTVFTPTSGQIGHVFRLTLVLTCSVVGSSGSTMSVSARQIGLNGTASQTIGNVVLGGAVSVFTCEYVEATTDTMGFVTTLVGTIGTATYRVDWFVEQLS